MRRLVATAAECFALAGGVLLIGIVLVTATNVGAFALDRAARLVGGNVAGLPGYEDFVRLAMSCAVLMMLPWCQHRRGHVAVDLFVDMLGARMRVATAVASTLGTIALALFLAGWMALGLLETRADGTLSRVLGWPEWPFYAPGVLSLLLWAAVAACQLGEAARDGSA